MPGWGGRPGEAGLLGELPEDAVGVAVAHRELALDHLALALEFALEHDVVAHPVGEQPDRRGGLVGGGVDVVADGVQRRRRVGLGTHAAELGVAGGLGGGGGGAAGEQVLEEVREAGAHVLLLVERAGLDPDLRGDHRGGRDLLHDDDHPVGQDADDAVLGLGGGGEGCFPLCGRGAGGGGRLGHRAGGGGGGRCGGERLRAVGGVGRALVVMVGQAGGAGDVGPLAGDGHPLAGAAGFGPLGGAAGRERGGEEDGGGGTRGGGGSHEAIMAAPRTAQRKRPRERRSADRCRRGGRPEVAGRLPHRLKPVAPGRQTTPRKIADGARDAPREQAFSSIGDAAAIRRGGLRPRNGCDTPHPRRSRPVAGRHGAPIRGADLQEQSPPQFVPEPLPPPTPVLVVPSTETPLAAPPEKPCASGSSAPGEVWQAGERADGREGEGGEEGGGGAGDLVHARMISNFP